MQYFKPIKTLLKFHFKRNLKIKTTSKMTEHSFEKLKFDNLVLRTLPIDPITENYIREVPNACFSKVKPTPLKNPKLTVFSKSAMALLDLNEEQLERKDAAEYLSGNKLMEGSETAAHCYCGHQFGVFAGQLGDGAALYLGEVLNSKNERWEIQLKGAGLTPYSRTADGRKVLRSTLREFLCSEAMHFLNVPTTRAGSFVVSDSKVVRDVFYNGNPQLEKCAVVLRIAPSFIRFGSFEIFKPLDRSTGGRGPSCGRNDILTTLLNYVSDNLYKDIMDPNETNKETKYEKVFEEVVRRTSELVAGWQCCGFVHGVLNTDNMSILGITIDYGPYGFLDRYDPHFIFNGSDSGGRYTYNNQPDICEWNLNKLAEALDPALPVSKSKAIVTRLYKNQFKKHYLDKMRKKLGLFTQQNSDESLIEHFMSTMYETGADFTNSFRHLSLLSVNKDNFENDISDFLKIIIQECSLLNEYREIFKPKFPEDTLKKLELIMAEQPEVLTMFGLSEAIVKNQLILSERFKKIKDWKTEDKVKNDSELWSIWLNKYLNRIYEEINNSTDSEIINKRIDLMNANNPRFVLRNHLAQDAIEYAEKDDFERSKMLLRLLENSHSDKPLQELLGDFEAFQTIKDLKFFEKPPPINRCAKLTCSS